MAWTSGQVSSLFIVMPLSSLASTIVTFAIVPAWLPWIAWIPFLGRFFAGRAASAIISDDGSTALSGRLENLTLVRAAGVASMLPGELAILSYSTSAVLSSAMMGALRAAGSRAGEGGRRGGWSSLPHALGAAAQGSDRAPLHACAAARRH